MKVEDFLSQYRVARNIKRFSMETVLSPQDLTGHGYGVANIYALLCKGKFGHVDGDRLLCVMNHDFVETYTGDLNKHIKDRTISTSDAWACIEGEVTPEHLRYLADDELHASLGDTHSLFLLADAFEAFMYTNEEVHRGNRFLEHCRDYYKTSCLTKIRAMLGDAQGKASDLVRTLHQMKEFMENE